MSTKTLLATTIVLGLSSLARAADPEIHVSWDESPAPIPDQDYSISTESPASVDFPDVRLLTGSLTWRVWSTDTDNPSSIGDIGVISCPAAANFGVKIEGNGGSPGARQINAINLDPQGSGSDGNYSRITGGATTGALNGDLYLQESSGGASVIPRR